MAGAGRYIVTMTNDLAPNNESISTYFIGDNTTDVAKVAAQLIAFSQWHQPAVGTRITGIEYSVAPTGGTLPVPFPVTSYAIISPADPVLVPMADYGVPFGFSSLAALGVGMVLSKRSTTPGRTGRGRLTSAFLGQGYVTAAGDLNPGTGIAFVRAWDGYLRDTGSQTRDVSVIDLLPYIESSTGAHLITNVTVSNRLGRLRSRSR